MEKTTENKEKKKKEEPVKKGVLSKIIIVFLLMIIAGLVGFVAGSQGWLDFKDIPKENTKEDKEPLIEGYSFSLKDIECSKEENSCTKELRVSYNNANHVVKVIASVTGENKNSIKYTLYIDDKEEHTVNDSGLRLLPGEDIAPYLNIEGFIYVFDKTNIAFVLPTWSYKLAYIAYVFNPNNSYMREVPITGFGFTKDDTDYWDINATEFDGHTLKVWDRDCNDDSKGIQYAITIENGSLVFKQLQTISDVISGGLAGCKYKNETIS